MYTLAISFPGKINKKSREKEHARSSSRNKLRSLLALPGVLRERVSLLYIVISLYTRYTREKERSPGINNSQSRLARIIGFLRATGAYRRASRNCLAEQQLLLREKERRRVLYIYIYTRGRDWILHGARGQGGGGQQLRRGCILSSILRAKSVLDALMLHLHLKVPRVSTLDLVRLRPSVYRVQRGFLSARPIVSSFLEENQFVSYPCRTQFHFWARYLRNSIFTPVIASSTMYVFQKLGSRAG